MTYALRRFDTYDLTSIEITSHIRDAEAELLPEEKHSIIMSYRPNSILKIDESNVNTPITVHSFQLSESIAISLIEEFRKNVERYSIADEDSDALSQIDMLKLEDGLTIERAARFAWGLLEMEKSPEEAGYFSDGLSQTESVYIQNAFAEALMLTYVRNSSLSFPEERVFLTTAGSYVNLTEESSGPSPSIGYILNNLPSVTPKIIESKSIDPRLLPIENPKEATYTLLIPVKSEED